jgi:hypothetical protein
MPALNDLNDDQIRRQLECTQREIAEEDARLRARQMEQIQFAIAQQTPSLAEKDSLL